MNIQTIRNVADCKPLYLPHSLYLKPLARLHLSVALPSSITGKSICNWDVMEKLRNLILPDTFASLRVSKTTIEFIRLDAEVEDRGQLKHVVNRLDGASIKLPGFSENMRIRSSEPKDDYATRHDWDSFFRDAKNMDEMKAGERPDTIYIANLPIKWFCPRHQVNADHPKPSESIFKRIFEKFGDVRCVDIPICDPYRGQMKNSMTGLKTFSIDNETYFEGYIQFNEYLGFVKAMDEFRGMKLVHKEGELSQAINIIVDFDKTKHLSDASIKRRKVVRDRLIEKEKEVEEEERKKREQLELKKRIELEKLAAEKRKEEEKQQQREARRKEKQLKKLKAKENMDFQSKIIAEERKLLQAQRKLESIRLLEALFARIQMKNKDAVEEFERNEKKSSEKPPRDLREKLLSKYKNAHEGEFKKRMDKVRKVREGKVILTDLLHADGKRSPSIDSISSDDSLLNEEKKKSRKKKKKKRSSSSSSTSSSGSSGSASSKGSRSKKDETLPPGFPPQHFPPGMYNPDMDWYAMNMYPQYGGYFPNAAPMPSNFYPGNGFNPNFRGGFRGRPRGRGRGFSRGSRFRDYDRRDYDRDRRTRSRSRSYSRSRSRSRSRSPSRRNRNHSDSRKLVSTLRSRRTPLSADESTSRSRRRTRSRSRSRSRSNSRAWSRRRRHRSSSSSSESSRDSSRHRHRSSRRRSSKREIDDKSERRERTPPRESKESPEKKKEKENGDQVAKTSSSTEDKNGEQRKDRSPSRKKSPSVDSSKFVSPKRKERSKTPEWSNKN